MNTVPLPQAMHSLARREGTQNHATNRVTSDPTDSCPNPDSACYNVSNSFKPCKPWFPAALRGAGTAQGTAVRVSSEASRGAGAVCALSGGSSSISRNC